MVVDGCFSNLKSLTSGVAQGSVRGPLLRVVSINNSDTNVGGVISKSVDGMEVGGAINSKVV